MARHTPLAAPPRTGRHLLMRSTTGPLAKAKTWVTSALLAATVGTVALGYQLASTTGQTVAASSSTSSTASSSGTSGSASTNGSTAFGSTTSPGSTSGPSQVRTSGS